MARKIVWSNPAVDDLETAVEFIAQDSSSYAANLAQLAVDAVESLVPFPTVVTGYPIQSLLASAN